MSGDSRSRSVLACARLPLVHHPAPDRDVTGETVHALLFSPNRKSSYVMGRRTERLQRPIGIVGGGAYSEQCSGLPGGECHVEGAERQRQSLPDGLDERFFPDPPVQKTLKPFGSRQARKGRMLA